MHPNHTSKFPELAFYGLPGHTRTPRDILNQAQDAEALGIGGIMISERADYKEIAAVCGAVAAVTDSIFISTSGTNLNTRHPVITASMGSTLSSLSQGRFSLCLAKGVKLRWQAMNVDFPTYAREEAFIKLLRQLWRGETVMNHDSELGQYHALQLAHYVDEDIPVLYVGFGPKSLENAGRIYDGAHLHTFMSDQALSNAVANFRAGEAQAHKSGGKLWSVFATACDVSDAHYLKLIVARLATYLQIKGYGELLVGVNGWDTEILRKFREAPVVAGMKGAIDSVATLDELESIEKLIPESWRPAAVGNAKTCAQRWVDQFSAGADGIIIHASTPEEFAPVLAEYEAIRPSHLFQGRTNRPG